MKRQNIRLKDLKPGTRLLVLHETLWEGFLSDGFTFAGIMALAAVNHLYLGGSWVLDAFVIVAVCKTGLNRIMGYHVTAAELREALVEIKDDVPRNDAGDELKDFELAGQLNEDELIEVGKHALLSICAGVERKGGNSWDNLVTLVRLTSSLLGAHFDKEESDELIADIRHVLDRDAAYFRSNRENIGSQQ